MIEDRSTQLSQLRTLGLRLGASALYHSGALGVFQTIDRWRKQKLEQNLGRFMILLYHRVNPDKDPLFPAVSPRIFDAHMGYLAKNFKVRSLADIVSRVQRGKTLEPSTIAVTFDDGYKDNHAFAHPILKKYGLPATLFVATGFIGSNRLMWNDSLAWALKNTNKRKIACEIGRRELVIPIDTQADRTIALDCLLEELKMLPEDQKQEAVGNLIDALGTKSGKQPQLMLNWDELRKMAQEGWNIGSHTVDHAILTSLQPSRAAEELRVSKQTVEREIQQPADLFAFPNGKQADFNSDMKQILKRCGYRGAATTLRGINDENVDRFELRRWSVWETHLPTLACKLGYLYGRQMVQ